MQQQRKPPLEICIVYARRYICGLNTPALTSRAAAVD
jgi:hypothetical protein